MQALVLMGADPAQSVEHRLSLLERNFELLVGGAAPDKLAALARALISGTKLLLLDEPFEGVAPALAQRLARSSPG